MSYQGSPGLTLSTLAVHVLRWRFQETTTALKRSTRSVREHNYHLGHTVWVCTYDLRCRRLIRVNLDWWWGCCQSYSPSLHWAHSKNWRLMNFLAALSPIISTPMPCSTSSYSELSPLYLETFLNVGLQIYLPDAPLASPHTSAGLQSSTPLPPPPCAGPPACPHRRTRCRSPPLSDPEVVPPAARKRLSTDVQPFRKSELDIQAVELYVFERCKRAQSSQGGGEPLRSSDPGLCAQGLCRYSSESRTCTGSIGPLRLRHGFDGWRGGSGSWVLSPTNPRRVWLLPRFWSGWPACFAPVVGTEHNSISLLGPREGASKVGRLGKLARPA